MGLRRNKLALVAFSIFTLCLISVALLGPWSSFELPNSFKDDNSLSKFVFGSKSSTKSSTEPSIKPSIESSTESQPHKSQPHKSQPHKSQPLESQPLESQPAKKIAFATFLSTRIDDDKVDDYFDAARVLNYQLIHAPETRSQENIPFLVVVTNNVSQRKRDRLAKDGAIVIVMETLSNSKSDDEKVDTSNRWIDQYTKLKLWTLTEYDRILYIDSDMLVTKPLDGVFNSTAAPPKERLHVVPDKEDEAPLPQNYLIAGVTDAYGRDHAIPVPNGEHLNGGFFLMKPDLEIFDHYMSVLKTPEKYEQVFMEQGLLNYVHRQDGNVPWARLEPSVWNVNWPTMKDYDYGTASLHDKFWEGGEAELQKKWAQVKGQMEGFWLRVDEEKGKGSF